MPSHFGKRYASILYAIFALAIVGYFAFRCYQVVITPLFIPSVTPLRPPSVDKVDVSRIADFHLFGQVRVAAAKEPEPQLEAARPSNRSYRIAGLAQSMDSDASSVLFELKPGDMAFFRVGDQVEDGVKVARIVNDSVYLEVNRRLERLDVPADKERLFIPVRPGSTAIAVSEEYSWDWLAQWDELTDSAVAEQLGLQWQDDQWVITSKAPFISSRQIQVGFRVLGVNGVAVEANSIKAAFAPLKAGRQIYIMLQTPRKRVSVRWGH